MADQPVVIIKRRKRAAGHGHHGGAWKIAYADFVTAMMAFFLLMWLLATTTDEQRRGIAEYFENPLRVSARGGDSVGERDSVLRGGGEDFRRQDGQMLRGPDQAAADQILEQARLAELENLQELKGKIEASIDRIPSLLEFKGQLLIDLTSEGLRLQIIDQENRPMFASGSAELQPYARQLLGELSNLLSDVDNRISIAGHTDAMPFQGGYAGYSNWELSNDRANAARRALVQGGLDPEQVMRVVGLASTVLLDTSDPFNPVNRRISIVIMNREAAEAVSLDGGTPVIDHLGPAE